MSHSTKQLPGTVVADSSNISLRPAGQGLQAGSVVNRLTVEGWQFRINHNWRVIASCSCSSLCTPRVQDLVAEGKVISCGCHKSEQGAIRGKAMWTTHGGRYTPLYDIWRGMQKRCDDSLNHNYGGRGISVCREWRESFPAFRDWAVNAGYRKGLSIDRYPNNDGNYEPSNCRWATASEQGNNTRRTRMLTFCGETKPLTMWAREFGIPYGCLKSRIRDGWSDEDALTRPVRGVNR